MKHSIIGRKKGTMGFYYSLMFIIVILCIKIYCATCAREHDGQPKLPYGQTNFRVVGHMASCPEKFIFNSARLGLAVISSHQPLF